MESNIRLKTFEILEELHLTVDGLDDLSVDDYRKIARLIVNNIADNLPDNVDSSATTLNSKLPFKSLVLREVLIHRLSELSSVALQLYDEERIVSAFVMTRSVLETVSVMFCLHKFVAEFNVNHDIKKLDAFLLKGIMGSRDKSTPIEAVNILTAVDKVDKEFAGLRKMYDCLCEYTHPNWSGMLGSFGTYDDESFCLNFNNERSKANLSRGFAPFVQSLVMATEYYNGIGQLILDMNNYFETQADK